jgi:hypothetical protein
MMLSIQSCLGIIQVLIKDIPLSPSPITTYFAEIEQAAFSPSTMVPGIAPSADPSTS